MRKTVKTLIKWKNHDVWFYKLQLQQQLEVSCHTIGCMIHWFLSTKFKLWVMSLEIFLRNWSNDLLEWSMIYRTWPIKITSWHKFQNPNDFSFEIKIVKYWSKLDWSVIKKLKNVSDDVLDDVLVAEFNDFCLGLSWWHTWWCPGCCIWWFLSRFIK